MELIQFLCFFFLVSPLKPKNTEPNQKQCVEVSIILLIEVNKNWIIDSEKMRIVKTELS